MDRGESLSELGQALWVLRFPVAVRLGESEKGERGAVKVGEVIGAKGEKLWQEVSGPRGAICVRCQRCQPRSVTQTRARVSICGAEVRDEM